VKKKGKPSSYNFENLPELPERKKNEALSTLHKVGIIELSRAHQPRQEIANQMHVHKNTVTSVIQDFIASGNPRAVPISKPSKGFFLDHKE
jgi:hypothetical protein